MKNKNRHKIIIMGFSLLLTVIFTSSLFSQINHGLYFIKTIPQNAQLNPAFQINNKLFIGIPVLNRIDNEIKNDFKLDDILISRNDSLYSNPGGLLKALDDLNSISENSTVNLIYGGFKKGKNSFHFGVSIKSSLYGNYSKNLTELLLLGNSSFVGKTTDFGNNNLLQLLYQEYSVSYARQLTPKFSVGITPKFIVGIFNAQIKQAAFSLTIDQNTYVHSGKAHVLINTSTNVQNFSEFTNAISPSSWFKFSHNLGYAFDIGADYKINKQIELSASLLDIGKIKWNNKPKNYSVDADSVYFDGITLGNIYDNKFFTGDITDKLIDNFTNSFNMQKTDNTYVTKLVPKLLFSASYSFFEKNKIGTLFYSELFYNKPVSSFSINYLRQFGKILTIGCNYNNYNLKASNIGLTILLQMDILQIYFATNSMLGLITPEHTNVYQVSFGINFILDQHSKKSTEEQIDKTNYN